MRRAQGTPDGDLGAPRRLARDRARRVGRHRRPERLRQDDPPAPARGHLQADERDGSRSAGSVGIAARARRRVPPGLHRAGEHLPERRDLRDEALEDPRVARRHHRVHRARALHRPARAHVLVRDVHAPRVRDRGAHRRRRPAARRGLRGRRRGFSAQVHRPRARVQAGGRDDGVRLALPVRGRADVRPRGAPPRRPGRLRRRGPRRPAPLSGPARGRGRRRSSETGPDPSEWGSHEIRITRATLAGPDGVERHELARTSRRACSIWVASESKLPPPEIAVELRDRTAGSIGSHVQPTAELGWDGSPGERVFRFELDRLPVWTVVSGSGSRSTIPTAVARTTASSGRRSSSSTPRPRPAKQGWMRFSGRFILDESASMAPVR